MNSEDLSIRPGAAEPIYRQIVEQLRRLIASKQLFRWRDASLGTRCAGQHAINPMTVSRAYGLLELEGLLERQRGKVWLSRPPAAVSRRTTGGWSS